MALNRASLAVASPEIVLDRRRPAQPLRGSARAGCRCRPDRDDGRHAATGRSIVSEHPDRVNEPPLVLRRLAFPNKPDNNAEGFGQLFPRLTLLRRQLHSERGYVRAMPRRRNAFNSRSDRRNARGCRSGSVRCPLVGRSALTPIGATVPLRSLGGCPLLYKLVHRML